MKKGVFYDVKIALHVLIIYNAFAIHLSWHMLVLSVETRTEWANG